jgi:hypothetical protein
MQLPPRISVKRDGQRPRGGAQPCSAPAGAQEVDPNSRNRWYVSIGPFERRWLSMTAALLVAIALLHPGPSSLRSLMRVYPLHALHRYSRALDHPDWHLGPTIVNEQGFLVLQHSQTKLRFVLVPESQPSVSNGVSILVCATECSHEAWLLGGGQRLAWAANSLPVLVTWEEARRWCAANGFRLPLEAEWEAACSAGSDTDFCGGDTRDSLREYAWYRKNSGGQVRPVGSRRANAWGLSDMHGNAPEWCGDLISPLQLPCSVSPTPCSEPMRPRRGGAFFSPARHCTSKSRWVAAPGRELGGFRPVFALPR